MAFSCLLLLINIIAKAAISQNDSFHLEHTHNWLCIDTHFKRSWNLKHIFEICWYKSIQAQKKTQKHSQNRHENVSLIWFIHDFNISIVSGIMPKEIMVLVAMLLYSLLLMKLCWAIWTQTRGLFNQVFAIWVISLDYFPPVSTFGWYS